jgi:hypothetical protein
MNASQPIPQRDYAVLKRQKKAVLGLVYVQVPSVPYE